MANAAPKLMTQAEYARHRGCGRVAVHKAVAAGRISTIGDDKRIDPAVADIQWAQNTRARAGTAAPAAPAEAPDVGDQESYLGARARREQAEAELAELKLGEQRRELIRVDVVRAQLAAKVSATREGLMQLPSRLAPVLAAEADAARVHDLLQVEIAQALEQLAAAPTRLGADAAS